MLENKLRLAVKQKLTEVCLEILTSHDTIIASSIGIDVRGIIQDAASEELQQIMDQMGV